MVISYNNWNRHAHALSSSFQGNQIGENGIEEITGTMEAIGKSDVLASLR